MAGDSATFGHTATNDSLAQMARGLISGCVESRGGIGGFMTFGLGGTIDDLSEVSGRGIYGGLTGESHLFIKYHILYAESMLL